MSAKALFTPGTGDYFTPANDRIASLPKGTRVAAQAVWNAIMSLLPIGKTELSITDHMLKQAAWLSGYSYRFVQKGLQALSPNLFNKQTQKWSGGLGLIDRKRRRGHRTIIVLARLRGSEREAARAGIRSRREQAASAPRAAPYVPLAAAIAAAPIEPKAESPEEAEERRRLIAGFIGLGRKLETRPEAAPLDEAETERRKAQVRVQHAAIRDGPREDTGSPDAPSGP